MQTSKERSDEISQSAKSVTRCLLPGHDFKVVRTVRCGNKEMIVVMKCNRCGDVRERKISEAMAQQFLMPRKPNEMMCLLLHGHDYAETDEIDPITGKRKRVCLRCGAEDRYELKRMLEKHPA
jgi:hypothetical protein